MNTTRRRRLVKFGLAEVDKLFEDREIKPTSKRRRCDFNGKNTKDDLISNLPTETLEFIVSLLTMREGAATSVLSRRWRSLWSKSVSHVILTDSNVLGYKRKENQFFQKSETTKFLTRIDHILQQCNPLNMETLQLDLPLGYLHAVHIKRWIELAQRVTKLKVDFTCPGRDGGKCISSKCKFPLQSLSSSLTHLSLRYVSVNFPPELQNLKSLKSLELADCRLNSDDIQNILSNCHSLEWLSLTECGSFPEHTILRFVGPSIRLKHLHIDNDSLDLEKIEVHDLRLVSFELTNRHVDLSVPHKHVELSIKNVPHLAWLMLNTNGPVEIQGSLPRLDTLFLRRKKSKLPNISLFNNLKRLVFMVDQNTSNLLEATWFLAACPLLQQLELNMCDQSIGLSDQNSRLSTAPGCLHHNLREVSIHGFDSRPELIGFARHLLKNAVVLEKMIINTTYHQSYHGNGMSILCKTSTKLLGMPVEKVRKMLQKESQSFTEILIA